MALTPNQQQARERILAWRAAGCKRLPVRTGPGGAVQTNHGEHRGWVAEALAGTDLVFQAMDGEWLVATYTVCGQNLYNNLADTQWGEDLHALWASDGSAVAGWVDFPPNRGNLGKRAPFWTMVEEAACNRLGGTASFESIPGLSSLWPKETVRPPQTRREWLMKLELTWPHEAAILRAELNEPGDGEPPVDGDSDGGDPPTDPSGLRAELQLVTDLLREADELEVAEGFKRNEARERLLAALAELGEQP